MGPQLVSWARLGNCRWARRCHLWVSEQPCGILHRERCCRLGRECQKKISQSSCLSGFTQHSSKIASTKVSCMATANPQSRRCWLTCTGSPSKPSPRQGSTVSSHQGRWASGSGLTKNPTSIRTQGCSTGLKSCSIVAGVKEHQEGVLGIHLSWLASICLRAARCVTSFRTHSTKRGHSSK